MADVLVKIQWFHPKWVPNTHKVKLKCAILPWSVGGVLISFHALIPYITPMNSITHGQCDVWPTVTFPSSKPHGPLTSVNYTALQTKAQVCERFGQTKLSPRQLDAQPVHPLRTTPPRNTRGIEKIAIFVKLYEGYIFRERELRFTFAICCLPSVCLSSATFVHPTQSIEIFGNVSTPFGTLAIHWHPRKILAIYRFLRWYDIGNPSIEGVKRKIGSQISLIGSRIFFSIATKIGDLEWHWTA